MQSAISEVFMGYPVAFFVINKLVTPYIVYDKIQHEKIIPAKLSMQNHPIETHFY